MTPDRNDRRPAGKTEPKDRRIVLGQPGYGMITAGAGRGFWRASRLPDWQIHRPYHEGSLLASNFNSLWCEALNQAHHGRTVTHFAMIHADVEPVEGWLDTLVDELEDRDLDVLGVVVPLKDTHGLTSVALNRPDGDTWRPLCRLTMEEVYRLPETFTSADAGHPILLNTGLWVCRFDMRWAKQLYFTINDRIAFDTRLDRYVAECEPEDWFFSRGCHDLGLKVGCTRKVPLTHRGTAGFPNGHVWGDQKHDVAWTDRSQLPESLPDVFALPDDIDGWLRPEEGRALADLARGKRVLEIGSFCGLSTVCMARTAESVVAVDYFDGRATPTPGDTSGAFRANLERFGVADRVTISHPEAAYPLPPYDLVFIDGAHDYDSVQHDIGRALESLAPGGLIAFHDYRAFPGQFDGRWDPGVTQAVNELLGSGGTLISTHATLAVVNPPALVPLPLEV